MNVFESDLCIQRTPRCGGVKNGQAPENSGQYYMGFQDRGNARRTRASL
jgi:hypothetical protein